MSREQRCAMCESALRLFRNIQAQKKRFADGRTAPHNCAACMQTPPADEWERAAPHLPCRLFKSLLYVELQYHFLLLCRVRCVDAKAYGLVHGGWLTLCDTGCARVCLQGA